MRIHRLIPLLLLAAAPGVAQMPTEAPGKPSTAGITSGTYTADPAHSQVAFSVNHLGFNAFHGLFGAKEGTLVLDVAHPERTSVTMTFALADIATTSAALNKHLMTPDFFDAEKFPTATFKSTRVTVSGTTATVTGDLTVHGVTKPVTLAAHFVGAGRTPAMMGGKEVVGFEATATLKRSDWGVNYGIPLVSDAVSLEITAAFEK